MEKGFLYVAVGDDYFQEAIMSAESVSKVMPDIPISIVTEEDRNHEYFDNVIIIDEPEYGYIDKITGMKQTPYDKTVYLDTDTYLYERVDELFEILDQFDIAASPAPNREIETQSLGVPDCFPEFNTGVIAYTHIPAFFDTWYELYQPEQAHDQPAFRKAVYDSDLRPHTLPREYNCMFNFPGHLVYDAKILHGRLYNFNSKGHSKWNDVHEMAERLNKYDGHRHYGYDGNVINCKKSLKKRTIEFISRGQTHIEERGILWTMKRFLRFLHRHVR